MFTSKLYTILAGMLMLAGSLWAQDHLPTAAPAIKSFSSPTDISGAAANSVNLFSGDVMLPVDLFSVPGHNGLNLSVSISYSSNVQLSVDLWNLEGAAGILGLGWSLDLPRIVCDHKQTGTREDDEYFLVEGGSNFPLIRTSSGSDTAGNYYLYESKQYQFWQIRFYYDPVEMGTAGSGPNKWTIVKENGHKYVYGDKNSNRSTIQWMVRWNNWIGNSSQITGQSRFAIAWNLSEIINLWNEKIIYEYDNVEQFVGSSSGLKHTEASYLKSITDVFGRKASFIYKDKQLPYFLEPHTEKAEPDAYQEMYEKKYLDRIDLLTEAAAKLLSVQFGYNILNSGLNTAKMLLTSIVQKNASDNALPGMKFTYNSSGPTKGYINSITYPTGGTVTYTYTEKTIGHSNREIALVAPLGYSEPKVWMADDYAVVMWRELGSGGVHTNDARTVKVYAYQWVGEWKEQLVQTINNVHLYPEESTKDYKDFQVTLERDFFAVLARATNTTTFYNLYIFNKDVRNRGLWQNYSFNTNYGENLPTLVSGTNFVAALSYRDEPSQSSYLFTFQGDTWKSDVFDQSTGYHYYTGQNNFFISHNRLVNYTIFPITEHFNFSFLTEDKKWVTRNWGSSLKFSSDETSFWYSSNSMATVMADNNPEFVYRWDITYNNFYKDSKDKNNVDLFGQLFDGSQVFILNNSLVGIDGRLARFDGLSWTTNTISSSHNSPYGQYFSYGDDYVVRPTGLGGGFNYKGARKVFNPNTNNWEADVEMLGADAGLDFANAGIDYYYFGNGLYYRQPNGSWVKKFTFPSGQYSTKWSRNGYPRFQVFYGLHPYPITEILGFKNGETITPLTLSGRNLLFNPYKFKNAGVGGQTIATYLSGTSNHFDATLVYLNRMVNDAVVGLQKDYPVTLITINDGVSNKYITYDYNDYTATIDASGHYAQYNEVTEIRGSNTSGSKPFGYTKNYFHNGLTASELSQPAFTAEYIWLGVPYKKEIYDKDGQLKSWQFTTLQTFSKTLQNNLSTKVQVAYYVRPAQVKSNTDNIEVVTNNNYDASTGLLMLSSTNNYDSKGSTVFTEYKYFWQAYDVNRTLNLLSPIIQEKKYVVNGATTVITESSAVTWKSWNNIFASHKTYLWKRTGNADFNFSSWSDANEPPADWYKSEEVSSLSLNGNSLEVIKN